MLLQFHTKYFNVLIHHNPSRFVPRFFQCTTKTSVISHLRAVTSVWGLQLDADHLVPRTLAVTVWRWHGVTQLEKELASARACWIHKKSHRHSFWTPSRNLQCFWDWAVLVLFQIPDLSKDPYPCWKCLLLVTDACAQMTSLFDVMEWRTYHETL